MEMTIDESLSHLHTYSSTMGSGQTTQEQHEDAKRVAIETMRKYQQLQADYENRLKADLVAMLTELQLEIEELRLDRPLFSRGYECYGHEDKTPTEIRQECSDIIQEKINELKEVDE